MNPETALARFGGRRFVLVLLSCLLYTALLVGGYIGEATYLNLQLMTVGAFITGNVVQKFTDAKYAANNSGKAG